MDVIFIIISFMIIFITLFFSFSVYALAVTLQIFYMLIRIFERWFWMVCPLIIHFVLKFLQIFLNFPRDSP